MEVKAKRKLGLNRKLQNEKQIGRTRSILLIMMILFYGLETKRVLVSTKRNPQYDFPQCIKLPAPKKRPKMAALPRVVCPMYRIFIKPGTLYLTASYVP
uniref:Putative ovule protein n=1 Tax=Solanum chacoense TaxID=4108 RepID=A0A0V0H5Y2_SOLCH